MALLFRLPLLLLELLFRRLLRRGEDETIYAVTPDAPPAPAPSSAGPAFTGASTNGAPPPTAEEAIARRFEREAAEAANPRVGGSDSPTPLRPIAGTGHLDTEATLVESFGPSDDVNGTIIVDEPWPGYDGDSAASIVARLRDADEATKGVVALYEAANKGRKTVLKAVG